MNVIPCTQENGNQSKLETSDNKGADTLTYYASVSGILTLVDASDIVMLTGRSGILISVDAFCILKLVQACLILILVDA